MSILDNSNSLFCLSLIDQRSNPKRNWSRDTNICIDVSHNIEINNQIIHKNKVLENKIQNNGSFVNGSISKKSHYSQIATSGSRRMGRTYANQSTQHNSTNPNTQNLPFAINKIPGEPHLGYPVQKLDLNRCKNKNKN